MSRTRLGADSCPGVSRPFSARDGSIVRIRVPGGSIEVARLREMVHFAARVGTPFVHLTSRANVQLRGLPDPLPADDAAVLARLAAIASPAHERALNVLAEPFDADAAALAGELAAALVQRPTLVDLPGRFLFAATTRGGIEAGRLTARVAAEEPDVLVAAGADADVLVLRMAGGFAARRVEAGCGVARALDLAEAFLREREDETVWRLRDLPTGSPFAEALPGVGTQLAVMPGSAPAAGVHGDHLVVTVPLGMLAPDHVDALSAACALLGRTEIGLTPWRRLVLPVARRSGLVEARELLDTAGLPTRASAADHVTACVGAPWCRRTDIETLAAARALIGHLDLAEPDGETPAARLRAAAPDVHLVGCERRCGAPRGAHVDLVPTTGETTGQLAARAHAAAIRTPAPSTTTSAPDAARGARDA